MKYGKYLLLHACPEWIDKYVDYTTLKKFLKSMHQREAAEKKVIHMRNAALQTLPRESVDGGEFVPVGVASKPEDYIIGGERWDILRGQPLAEVEFVRLLEAELVKVSQFYHKKLKSALHRYRALENQVSHFQLLRSRQPHRTSFDRSFSFLSLQRLLVANKSEKELVKANKVLRKAFEELFRYVDLLENFRRLNLTAFGKILKKHDKNSPTKLKSHFLERAERALAPANESENLSELSRQIEDLYSSVLFLGDHKKAMRNLRLPVTEKQVHHWATFILGFATGFSLLLLIEIIVLFGVTPTYDLPRWDSIYLVYRGLALPILTVWYFGISAMIWNHFRVHYTFIFEFDLRRFLSVQQILSIPAVLTLIYLLDLMLYLLQARGEFYMGIAGEWIPFLLVVVYIVVLFCPLRVFYRSSRLWLLKTLGRCFAAPFFEVRFRDFWLADQLTSLVMMLTDMEYTFCFYLHDVWAESNTCRESSRVINPLISVIPATIRLIQCYKRYRANRQSPDNIYNAGKYSMTFLVVLFAALKANFPDESAWLGLWITAITAATIYTYLWDIRMDWGLGKLRSAQGYFLRDRLMYGHRFWYYFALVNNLFLRFAWTLTLQPNNFTLPPDVFYFVIAMAEVTRRFQWNLFRLENEHMNNCGKFRAVDDIPLPFRPEKISFPTEYLLHAKALSEGSLNEAAGSHPFGLEGSTMEVGSSQRVPAAATDIHIDQVTSPA